MFTKISLLDLDLQDALDLAILVEVEAQERYEEFARQIGTSSGDDAGAFFIQMALNEAKHATDLKLKRKQLFGDSPRRMSVEKLYEYQEIEAPVFDRAESFMSARKALVVALDSEIKAFNFFNKAEQIVTDRAVKALFKELKEEELQHQLLVKDILNSTPGDESPIVDPGDVEEPSGL
jgi:rubrerythrin